MEAITLVDLAPVLAAVLGPMLVFAAATMRYQHIDSTKTRDLIDKNREACERGHREAREHNERAHKEAREHNEQTHNEAREHYEQAHEAIINLIDKNREHNERAHKEAREHNERAHKEAREHNEQAHKEAREHNEQAHKEARERSEQAHKEVIQLIDRNHRELSAGLRDARERLSRIEGHLRISPPPAHKIDGEDAEAA